MLDPFATANAVVGVVVVGVVVVGVGVVGVSVGVDGVVGVDKSGYNQIMIIVTMTTQRRFRLRLYNRRQKSP